MNLLSTLLLVTGALMTEEGAAPQDKMAVVKTADPEKSVLFIEPKARASDYVQAYELLKKDKPALKINLRTASNVVSNVTDLSAAASGTLIFIKVPANSGSKYMILPLEDIVEISYSP